MDPKLTILGRTGLRFFGKMSAANAHEIKNALAVINENAGLLSDLVTMADRGIALNPQRLMRLSEKIKAQVTRADEIAKSTNRFAHSVDNMHNEADLGQSLGLVKTMAMRFATQRHISIEIVPPPSSITIPRQEFMVLHLLWLCLSCALEAANAEKTIQIEIIRSDDGTLVRFGPLSHLEEATVTALANSPETAELLKILEGEITADPKKEDLVLKFLKRPKT
jgi:C4-dicarboxylate-specific signal transduction histidine kinase